MSRQNGASNSLMTLDKRSKVMLGVLAVILVIAAAYFLVLKKGSSTSPHAGGAVPTPAASAPQASAAPKVKPLASPSAVVGRQHPGPVRAPGPGGRSDEYGKPGGAASLDPAAPSASPSTAPAGHTVGLLGISGTTASVSYDSGSATSVKVGSSIATGVTVEKIDSDSIFIKLRQQRLRPHPGADGHARLQLIQANERRCTLRRVPPFCMNLGDWWRAALADCGGVPWARVDGDPRGTSRRGRDHLR